MDIFDAAAISAAGIAAGMINAVVGSGTLITFPTLLALGYPPVAANVANTLGLVPGTVSAAYGYRRELSGQRARLLRLGTASLIGGLAGALLLLVLPDEAFGAIVPVLIVLACVLVLVQPRVSRLVRERSSGTVVDGGLALWSGVLVTGVYGGYFGAAQGVLLLALFGIFLHDGLQQLNAAKNVLASIVNGVAAIVFIAVSDVEWAVVAMIAVGSTVGGLLGARAGRALPQPVLRGVIVVVGLVAAVLMIVR
ncbi:sulfite exporter TauE/SafE family protein [Actinoplanes sp. NPDC049802]|uniref:sulfite exporter TauE/SafE family protein n=1 Tax=Actinoplanes sp. NPDC049802 TaxID=3154742 RepID=UPI0033F8C5CC